MRPAELSAPLVIQRGDTFAFVLTIHDVVLQGQPMGPPRNLTGFTPAAMIRTSADASGAALASFTCTPANQSTSPGVVVLSLTETQTRALPTTPVDAVLPLERGLPSDLLEFDMEVASAGRAEVSTYLHGYIRTLAEVTHA